MANLISMGINCLFRLNNRFYFVAFIVAVKVEFRLFARVESGFQGFDDDHVFKEIADQWISGSERGRFNAEQVGRESDIGKIDFWAI